MVDGRQKFRSSVVFITTGAFLAFFVFGFTDNLKGPTLPAVLRDLSFSYTQGGTIFMAAYMGFLVATLLTGFMSDLAGKRIVIFTAGVSLLLGITCYSVFSSFWALTAAMGLVGFGFGSIEVGGCTIVVDLHSKKRGLYLNLLSFFHGSGSLLAPLFAGVILNTGLSWRAVYRFDLILVVLLPLHFLFVRHTYHRSGGKPYNLRKVGKAAFKGDMVVYYFLMVFYVAAELGTAAWLVTFLQTAKGQTVMKSSVFFSLFYACITSGKLIGGMLVDRVGYLRIMIYASIAAIGCVAMGIFASPILAFFLPLTGFFYSIMYPTITAEVSKLHSENRGTILGILFTFAGLGGMLGPWLIGAVSDWMGITWGFSMLLLFCAGMLLALMILKSRGRLKRDP
jgi:fucose permease